MRVCAEPGCPTLTGTPYCAAHTRTRAPDAPFRGTATQRGYDSKWAQYARRFRHLNPYCRPCANEGIKSPTALVDHIQPVTGPKDPMFWRPMNHQPICRSCHARKTHAEGRTQEYPRAIRPEWTSPADQPDMLYPKGLLPSTIPLTVICGAPGSGKSRYVQEHAQPGDTVIDLDHIRAELSGLPLYQGDKLWFEPAMRERNRRLASLCTMTTGKAWFVCSAPKAWQREHWAAALRPSSIVVLLVPALTCIERMQHRPQAALRELERAATRWWADYTPRAGDTPLPAPSMAMVA